MACARSNCNIFRVDISVSSNEPLHRVLFSVGLGQCLKQLRVWYEEQQSRFLIQFPWGGCLHTIRTILESGCSFNIVAG